MSILSYKILNLLNTSVNIEDLGITLQSRGGQDGSCVISSDSYVRSASLRDLLNKRILSAQPIYNTITVRHVSSSAPQVPQNTPVSEDTQNDSNILSLQNEIRAMNSRFDEILTVLRTAPPTASPVYVQMPIQTAHPGQHDYTSSQPDDPIFIPSSIVPKGADVHISSNEESSPVEDFEDSLAALKAARKKKV